MDWSIWLGQEGHYFSGFFFFNLGFGGRILVLIVPAPGHCLSFTFDVYFSREWKITSVSFKMEECHKIYSNDETLRNMTRHWNQNQIIIALLSSSTLQFQTSPYNINL